MIILIIYTQHNTHYAKPSAYSIRYGPYVSKTHFRPCIETIMFQWWKDIFPQRVLNQNICRNLECLSADQTTMLKLPDGVLLSGTKY